MTARLTMRGTVAGSRTRSAIWVGAGSAGLRIEPADGSRSFVLTSSDQPTTVATLELPGRGRVETSDVGALVELATGVPLTSSELQGLLTTCPIRSGSGPVTLRTNPDALDLLLDASADAADVLHFTRSGESAPWRLLAMTSNRPSSLRWRTEFHAPIATVPKTFRLTSLDWKGEPSGELDVRVTVDRVQVSPMIEGRLFKPSDGGTDRYLTIAELKASGVRLPLILD